MPAESVHPHIDEEGEHEEVEGVAQQRAGEEGRHELPWVHRDAREGLTARTYRVGEPGVDASHQRAVMRSRLAPGVGRF